MKKGFLFTVVVLALIALIVVLAFYRTHNENIEYNLAEEKIRNKKFLELTRVVSEDQIETAMYMLAYRALVCLNQNVTGISETGISFQAAYIPEGGTDKLENVRKFYRHILTNGTNLEGNSDTNIQACMKTTFQDYSRQLSSMAEKMGFNTTLYLRGITIRDVYLPRYGGSPYHLPWHVDVEMNITITINDSEQRRTLTKQIENLTLRIPIFGLVDPVHRIEFDKMQKRFVGGTDSYVSVHSIYPSRRILLLFVTDDDRDTQRFDEDLPSILTFYGYPVDIKKDSDSLTKRDLAEYAIVFVLFVKERDINTKVRDALIPLIQNGTSVAIVANASTYTHAHAFATAIDSSLGFPLDVVNTRGGINLTGSLKDHPLFFRVEKLSGGEGEVKVQPNLLSEGGIGEKRYTSFRVVLDGQLLRFIDANVSPHSNARSFDNPSYIRNIADFLLNGNNRTNFTFLVSTAPKRGKGWCYGNFTEISQGPGGCPFNNPPSADILVIHAQGCPQAITKAENGEYSYACYILVVESLDSEVTGSEGNPCFDCLKKDGNEIKLQENQKILNAPFITINESDWIVVNQTLLTNRLLFVTDTFDESGRDILWSNTRNFQTGGSLRGYRQIYDIEWLRDLATCTHFRVSPKAPSFLHRHIDKWFTFTYDNGDPNGIESFFVLHRGVSVTLSTDQKPWDVSRLDWQFFNQNWGAIVPEQHPDKDLYPQAGYRVRGLPGCKTPMLCGCVNATPLRAFRINQTVFDMYAPFGFVPPSFQRHITCYSGNYQEALKFCAWTKSQLENCGME